MLLIGVTTDHFRNSQLLSLSFESYITLIFLWRKNYELVRQACKFPHSQNRQLNALLDVRGGGGLPADH